MKKELWASSLGIAALVALSLPGMAQEAVQIVPRGQETLEIHRNSLDPGSWNLYGPPEILAPSRGVITVGANGVVYDPDPEFWSLGFDSFAYSYPSYSEPVTVFLVADLKEFPAGPPAIEDCEIAEGWTQTGDPVQMSLVASMYSMNSECILQVSLGSTSTYAIQLDRLAGPGGGNTAFTLDTGGNGDPEDAAVPPEGSSPILPSLPILQGKTLSGDVAFEVEQLGIARVVVRARDSHGGMRQSESFLLPPGAANRLELNWWFSSGSGAQNGGAFLTVNGQLATEITGIDNFAYGGGALSWGVGVLAPTAGWSGTLNFGGIEVWTATNPPSFRPFLARNGEGDAASEWDSSTNLAKVRSLVTEGPDPEYSLPFPTRDVPVAFIADVGTPAAHLGVSFEVGLENVVALPGKSWTVAQTQVAVGSTIPCAIEIRRNPVGNGYDLRLEAFDGGQNATSPWTALPLGTERWELEVKFWAGDPATNRLGGVALKVDGAPWVTLDQLSNDQAKPSKIELGVLQRQDGLSGEVLLDDFFAWQ